MWDVLCYVVVLVCGVMDLSKLYDVYIVKCLNLDLK